MVKEKTKDKKTYYVCEVCKFAFKDKKWADKCEYFCREKGACNFEIIKHAVKNI